MLLKIPISGHCSDKQLRNNYMFVYTWITFDQHHKPTVFCFVFILRALVRTRELTPIEEASRLNQKLKANYEARLARLTPGQAYQKTSLVCDSIDLLVCVYVRVTLTAPVTQDFNQLHRAQQKHDADNSDTIIMATNRISS